MDRLETLNTAFYTQYYFQFTFQYGQIRNSYLNKGSQIAIQIYIPVWIDQKHYRRRACDNYCNDLHSSMDRLETNNGRVKLTGEITFTFQYGQIRN